jgi:hypothetical protein
MVWVTRYTLRPVACLKSAWFALACTKSDSAYPTSTDRADYCRPPSIVTDIQHPCVSYLDRNENKERNIIPIYFGGRCGSFQESYFKKRGLWNGLGHCRELAERINRGGVFEYLHAAQLLKLNCRNEKRPASPPASFETVIFSSPTSSGARLRP